MEHELQQRAPQFASLSAAPAERDIGRTPRERPERTPGAGPVAAPDDEFYRYHSKIYRSSEMLNLTHPTDYAAAWWVLPRWREGDGFAKGDTDPYMLVSISRDPEGEETLSDSEQEPYGMKTMDLATERTIDQLLKAARK
ncbi:hypothetical protein [Streptomyces sp. NPDC093094]|uniref:hypothetical protein n=1 Tax=Streptomyces sp. NPDC093094 TaxID=3366026 RepID=UPI003804E43F